MKRAYFPYVDRKRPTAYVRIFDEAHLKGGDKIWRTVEGGFRQGTEQLWPCNKNMKERLWWVLVTNYRWGSTWLR